MEDYTHTTTKNSSASVKEGVHRSIVGGSIIGPRKTGEMDRGSTKRTSAIRSEKKQAVETLKDEDYPARVGRTDLGNSMTRAKFFTPPTVPSHDLGPTKLTEDAYLLVDQKVQEEKEFMDVSSPIKPTPQPAPVSKYELGSLTKSTGQAPEKKKKNSI